MKKILCFILLQITFLGIYAQSTKTPTKQETMDWIAGKLKQYMRLPKNRTFISYSNGIFVYDRRRYTCDNRLAESSRNTIDLNKVSDYTICRNKPSQELDYYTYGCAESQIIGQNLIYTASTNYITGKSKNGYTNVIRIAGEDDVPCDPDDWVKDKEYTLFNFDLESGLLTRMQKALKALIIYNTVKGDEPY